MSSKISRLRVPFRIAIGLQSYRRPHNFPAFTVALPLLTPYPTALWKSLIDIGFQRQSWPKTTAKAGLTFYRVRDLLRQRSISERRVLAASTSTRLPGNSHQYHLTPGQYVYAPSNVVWPFNAV